VSSTVLWGSSDQQNTLTQSFQVNGVSTDPTAVSCIVTDPSGTVTTHTYNGASPADITRTSTGSYSLVLTCPGFGLWSYVWIGTGAAMQVQPGTFRVFPLSDAAMGMNTWYCGMEELKSRLGFKAGDTSSDYEIQLAIQNASNWVTNYTGQHFYQITEARTYMPASIWELPIDPLVSDPSVLTSLSVDLDYDGDGVYETHWTLNQNYVVKFAPSYTGGMDSYNINSAGVPQPYRQLQALMSNSGQQGGGWLPFTWPYTHMNRVRVTGTWGWNTVPPNVSHATLMLAVDLFKSKDAPWGMAGLSDLGIVKVQSNPWVVELLRNYINVRRKVGV
jgi:hypothetical protein